MYLLNFTKINNFGLEMQLGGKTCTWHVEGHGFKSYYIKYINKILFHHENENASQRMRGNIWESLSDMEFICKIYKELLQLKPPN